MAMNNFDHKLMENGQYPLTANNISTLQVNIGYKCNLSCTHCHVEASPKRQELMSLSTINKLLEILKNNKAIKNVDITGGSPELNPYYKHFIQSCTDIGKNVIVRTNLAIYSEPGMETIPEFLAENMAKIIASLPCYSEEGVDSQRGKGTYQKAINALKKLNSLGYGIRGRGLELDIMFNPAKTGIAPDQQMLENAYKTKLKEMHGITFNQLIALSNMPIGRLGKSMTDDEKAEFINELIEKFNSNTIDNVMCRHLVSISPDGRIYDCDFWQMLNMPVTVDNHVDNFDYSAISSREIVTTPLCFMCTAGAGASCSGALA